MRRGPSPETLAKVAATRATQRERRQQTLLALGAWRIWRIDDDNLVLEQEGGSEENRRYYPDMEWAVRALLQERISATARTNAEQVLAAIHREGDRIVAAIQANATMGR